MCKSFVFFALKCKFKRLKDRIERVILMCFNVGLNFHQKLHFFLKHALILRRCVLLFIYFCGYFSHFVNESHCCRIRLSQKHFLKNVFTLKLCHIWKTKFCNNSYLCYFRHVEHLIPKHMNAKWKETHQFYKEGDGDVEEFLLKFRERLYMEKRRKAR